MNYELNIDAKELNRIIEALETQIEALKGMEENESLVYRTYAKVKLPKVEKILNKFKKLRRKIAEETDNWWLLA